MREKKLCRSSMGGGERNTISQKKSNTPSRLGDIPASNYKGKREPAKNTRWEKSSNPGDPTTRANGLPSVSQIRKTKQKHEDKCPAAVMQKKRNKTRPKRIPVKGRVLAAVK